MTRCTPRSAGRTLLLRLTHFADETFGTDGTVVAKDLRKNNLVIFVIVENGTCANLAFG